MASSSSAPAQPTATKRACDACHRRKVRCNGANPCQNCQQAMLTCTFNKLPMKKGPKGSRAKVISELRKTQADNAGPGLSNALESPLSSPLFPPSHDLLTPDLVETSVTMFFERIYTTLPILHPAWLRQKAAEIHTSLEAHCLIGAFCAFMVIQPGVQPPLPPAMSPSSTSSTSSIAQSNLFGMRLVEDVKRRAYGLEFGDNTNTASVLTSFFLSATLFGLEQHKSAWYYLQEAILLARIMRIHDEKTYGETETPLDMMNRRIFYVLFVSERAQALQKHRDLTIHEAIQFPEPSEDPLDIVALPGLLCLHDLFAIVDDKMSEIWNNLRSQTPVVWPPNTAIWLTRLQKDLTEAMLPNLQVTEVQEVDLKTTQLWLRSIVWQLSTASGCLSSMPADRSMNFSYPIEIARELVELTSRVSPASMEAHGIGLVEKLFDIAFTLIDVMTVVPIETTTFEFGPRDHLAQILYLVSNLRNGESRFVGLLQAKIRESLPTLAATLNISLAPTPQSTTGANTDHTSLPDGSTASTPSSPYNSPASTNPALGSMTSRFPPLLVHSHSSGDLSGLQLNVPSPAMSEQTSAPTSAVDTTNPYSIPFVPRPGHRQGPGQGPGFNG